MRASPRSDPADNFFRDLRIGENGALTGGLGDRFIVSGDLITTSMQKERWQTGLAELRFSGGDGTHDFTVGGDDVGYSDAGFRNNFAWGIVNVSAGESLSLADDTLAGGALYVSILDLDGGVDQIAFIESNGLNIYYHPAFAENSYLGGQTWPLSGGGRLAPVPEPSSALLVAAGALMRSRRSRRCAR